MSQHVLLITCTSGSGHVIATENIRAELAAQNPDTIFHTLDTIQYQFPLKEKTVALWNDGIRRDSFITHFSSGTVSIYEFLYYHFFGKKLGTDLRALMHSFPIQTIIDTQPLFTPLMLEQIAQAAHSPLTYHKVLTDLPVDSDNPCFPGIKKRKQFDNIDFYIHGMPSLAKTQEEEAQFWKKQCNIDAHHVGSIWNKPVHNAFKTVPQDIHTLRVDIHDDLIAHYGLTAAHAQRLPEGAYVTTLMMGSQGLDAIEQYFDQILTQFADKSLAVPHYFFIACSKNQELFRKLLDKSLQKTTSHGNTKIIPLEMQSLENIASLMWRSQTILLRGSGLSCLEQLAMDEAAKKASLSFNPRRFIHSHCKKPIPARFSPVEQAQYLLKYSVGHEKSNAIYMQEKLGAMLTRADLIELM